MSDLEVAIDAAMQAGTILENYWGKLPSVEKKGLEGNLVTVADREAEACIQTLLYKKRPHYSFLGEESGGKRSKGPIWIVDPLDGTTNYTHQYPFVAVSIALMEGETALVAVVYNPIYKELFTAERGKGAYFQGESMRVSHTKTVKKALLATGFAYDRSMRHDNNYKEFCALTSASQGVRRLGSAALDLAYVALGRLDGFWESGLSSWDMAAGRLLVEEAGGNVTDFNGAPFNLESGRILATNGFIHGELGSYLATSSSRSQ